MRRAVRWSLLALILLVVLAAVVVVGGILWLRTPWGHSFVRGQIESRLEAALVEGGDVRLGAVEGDPLRGVTLVDFALVGPDGVALVEAGRVQVSYGLRPFFDRKIVIDRVRLVEPDVHLVRGPDGRWNFQTLWKPREPAPPGAPPGWGSHVDLREIVFVDGSVDVRLAEGEWPLLEWNENRFVDLNGEVTVGLFSRDRDLKRFVLRDLSFGVTAPPLEVRRLAGTGVVTPDTVAFHEIEIETAGSTIRADGLLVMAETDSLAIEVSAPRLSLAEANRFFPSVRLDGDASFEGRLVGPAGNPVVRIDEATVDTGVSQVAVSGAIEGLADPRLDLAATASPLAPSDVRAYLEAYPIEVPVSGPIRIAGPPRRLAVDADLRSPAGAFAVQGDLDLTGGPVGYDVAGTTRGLDVGRLIGEPRVDLVLTGRYSLAGRGFGERELDARVVVELGPSSVYRWDLVSLEARGHLTGRRFVADTVVARMPATVLRGAGTFGLATDGVLEVDVALASEDLGEVWPGLGDWADRLRADARLSGTYRGFDVAGDVTMGGFSLGPATADSFAGSVQLEDVAGEAFRMESTGTFRRFHVAGIEADTVGVEIDYAAGEMAIDADFDLVGDGSASALARADFRGPGTTVVLERLRYETPEQTWRTVEGGRLAWTEGRFVAEEFRLSQDGQTLRLDGAFEPEGTSDLAFAAENVALKDVARLLGEPTGDWQGRATIRGRLRGDRLEPVIEATGEVTEGMIRGFRFVRIRGEVDYADQVARIDLAITTPTEGHALVASGSVPIDLALVGGIGRLPERPVDLHVTGRDTDLSLLAAFLPGLEDLSGPVDIVVDVTGTSQAPRFEGRATVTNGRMTIVATGVTYRGIQGRVAFNNDRILVEEIRGTDGDDGTFRIAGTVAMQNLRLGELDLEATATELIVLDQQRRHVQINGNVAIGGTTETPRLTGRVVVDEAIYRLPERTGKDVIDLDEAVIYVDIPGTVPEPIGERSPSLWSRARLEIDIVVTDDAILQSSNARIEIAGDLKLLKLSGTSVPTFSGTLQVRRGFYEEFGRRFTIEGGEVFFYGTPELNPGLNIVATRTVENVEGVGDVNIRITLGGTLNNPTIDFSSTPEFEKSEILSIALFGTPTPAAGQESEFRDAVQGLVTGTATAQLTEALSSELGLDLLEVSRREEPGGDVATLFRVGKFLSPDVYLTFEQEVGGGQDVSRVALRYQISDKFTVQASAGTGSRRAGTQEAGSVSAGVDLFWEFTY